LDHPSSFETIKRRFRIRGGDGSVVVLPYERLKLLLTFFLESVPVDEEWYSATYPDVAEGIAGGTIASAKEHYARYGYFEGRLPREPAIDEGWYLSANPDIAEGIPNGGLPPKDHYREHGYREGRWPVRPPAYLE
jgi:hypothetical protein